MTPPFTRTFLLATDAPRISADLLPEALLKSVLSHLQGYQADHPECRINFGAMSLSQGERWLTAGVLPVQKASIREPQPAEPAGWDVLTPALLDKAVTDALDTADIPVLILLCSRTNDETWESHRKPLLSSPSLARTIRLICSMGSGGQHLTALLATGVKADPAENLLHRVKSLLEPKPVPANRMTARTADFLAGVVSRRTLPKATIAPMPTTTEKGRAKCRMMKAIRKAIADANGIPYKISECPSTEHCNGACPHCDAEARQLEAALTARAASGHTITMPSMTADLEAYLTPEFPLPVVDPVPDEEEHLLPGTIPPDPTWYGGLEWGTPDEEFL